MVAYCAARLQLQEKLARDIIDMLDVDREGKVGGFAIILTGTHMCKSMRGIRNKGEMGVSYYTGAFRESRQLRNEFNQMVMMCR